MLLPSIKIKFVILLALLTLSILCLPEAFASTAGGAKPMPYVAWLDNLRTCL